MSYTMASSLSIAQRLPSLFNPFVGVIADRMPLRFLVILTPGLTATVMSLLGIAPTYTLLVILLLIMGFSSSLFHIPSPVMIRQMAGKQIGLGMSMYMIGGEIARTLGPLIIVGAVSWWGLEGTWRLIPFGWAASLVLFLQFRRLSFTPSHQAQTKKGSIKATLRRHLQIFLLIAGFIFFRSILKQSLSAFLPVYLTEFRGLSFEQSGMLFALFQGAGIAGTFLAGPLSDRIGQRKTLLGISIISPILMWLFVNSGPLFALPLLFLLGFSIIASGPVILALVNSIDEERPAFINSVYMAINFGVGALAVLLVGFLSDFLGLDRIYELAPWISLAAIPLVWGFPSKNPGKQGL